MSTWCTLPETIAADTTIQCSEDGNMAFPYPAESNFTSDTCVYNGNACLFDIETDPCEYNNIAKEKEEIYQKMLDLLIAANQSQVEPLYVSTDADYKGADPKNHGGFWSPWMDVDVATMKPSTDLYANIDDEEEDNEPLDEEESMSYSARRIGAATAKMIDEHHTVSLIIVLSLAVMTFVVAQLHS